MNQAIQDFIDGKRIAVVGVSRSSQKFGNIACTELMSRGYQTFIVHPQAQEINGQRCYPSLTALQGQVDGVLVSVPPTQAAQVLRDAKAAGLTKIWLTSGSESPAVLDVARELGVDPITGRCILMYAQPVRGAHVFHRWFCRLTGQL